MTWIKRLKNLWKLSEWELSSKQIEDLHENGRKFAPLTKAPKMAQIIKRNNPVEDFLNKNE